MGSKILEFRQTPRGKEFSFLNYFYPKNHLIRFSSGLDWPCDLVSRFLGLNIGNFWDCFQTVRTEFSRLFVDSPDRFLRIIFGQDFRDCFLAVRNLFSDAVCVVFLMCYCKNWNNMLVV